MFDFQVSKHPHYDEACRAFALRHNMVKLSERAGMNVQTIRNKLNPEQPHQLTPPELWLLTDLTEDSTLVDGFLAQIHCLPCVPVNELAKDKLQSYVMRAMSELGELASGAVSTERLTPARKSTMIESVNAGIRMLSLSALALQARLQANPAMASAVDTMSGIGASFGLI
ncbi:TPA: phage regulatory CII family protein [Enterobacter hormaechei subsp. steigerwaltii]|nr:phage regulatory CII family protein [Enterobacter hormaechei subsp. steigerwaltii]